VPVLKLEALNVYETADCEGLESERVNELALKALVLRNEFDIRTTKNVVAIKYLIDDFNTFKYINNSL